MANFEAIAQRVFEENCVERWVMLVEGNTRSCRARVGIGKNVEEIRSDAAVAPSIAVSHDSCRRWFSTEERHEGIVERTHGIRIANPQIDVTEQRKRICFKITQPSLVRAGAIFREVHAVRVGAVMV